MKFPHCIRRWCSSDFGIVFDYGGALVTLPNCRRRRLSRCRVEEEGEEHQGDEGGAGQEEGSEEGTVCGGAGVEIAD